MARFTYWTADQSLDGNSGSWTIFDPDNTQQFLWKYTWSIDSHGNYTASLLLDGSSSESLEIIDNADGSGKFTYYEDGTKQGEVIWNSNGSGTYWISTYDGGQTGTWTAGK